MLQVNPEFCNGCGLCMRSCPSDAISLFFNKAHIDQEKCTGCENCITVCPQGAIQAITSSEIGDIKSRLQNLRQKIKMLSSRLDKFPIK